MQWGFLAMAKNKETGGRVSKETRLLLLNLPSDCHRPRAIAGEGAQVFAREPSRCRQRQHCARQTLARASLENSRTPLPGNVPLFLSHLTPGGRAWADHPFAAPLGGAPSRDGQSGRTVKELAPVSR